MRARVELPRAAWPLADRITWDEMFREGDLLDGRGAAVHWSEATRQTNAKHYARWLGWLAANGLIEAGVDPWERARPERVDAYARSLIDRAAPRTAASALIGLKCVLQRMHPDGDWRWLKDLTNRLDRWARPSRDNPAQGLSAPDLFALTLAVLEERARGLLEKRRDQLLYRDTLIVALLIACPLRLRNLAMMRIDDHLRRIGQEWHVQFDGSDTKTGQPVHLVLPSELDQYIAVYLDRVWPAFRRAPGDMQGNGGDYDL